MIDSRLQGHALIALGLTAMLAAAPPEPADPAELQMPAPAQAAAFVALQPFDEQLVAPPTDSLDGAARASSNAAPPDPAGGLFAA